jgi:hypothetical protein
MRRSHPKGFIIIIIFLREFAHLTPGHYHACQASTWMHSRRFHFARTTALRFLLVKKYSMVRVTLNLDTYYKTITGDFLMPFMS